MSLRNDIRTQVIAAIESACVVPASHVYAPRDWPTNHDNYPCVLVQAPGTSRASKMVGMPEFDTTVRVEVVGRVEYGTAEAAQDAIEALVDALEQAVFTYEPLVRMTQRFSSVDMNLRVTATGERHIGECEFIFFIEAFEYFDPTEEPLGRIQPGGSLIEPDTVAALDEVDITVAVSENDSLTLKIPTSGD